MIEQSKTADASLDEISEQVAILAALRRSERAADAGQLVAHDEVKQRLSSWLTPSRNHKPTAM